MSEPKEVVDARVAELNARTAMWNAIKTGVDALIQMAKDAATK